MTTEQLETAHGEVEYETVECVSCGNNVVKEDAKRMYIGTYHGRDTWGHKRYDEIKLSEYDDGWVCAYCQNDPAGFPQPNALVEFARKRGDWLVGLMFTLGVIGIVLIISALVQLVAMLL